MSLWEQVLGYIYLTLVWLVFCIPLVTIGAATSAFYGTARRYLMAQEGHLLPTFLAGFSQQLSPEHRTVGCIRCGWLFNFSRYPDHAGPGAPPHGPVLFRVSRSSVWFCWPC